MASSKRAVFDLGALNPEPDVIIDHDGTQYELRPASQFTTDETVRLSRLQRMGANLQKQLKDKSKEQQVKGQIGRISAEITSIIIPGMTRERIADMPEGERGQLFNFWQKCQAERTANATSTDEGGDDNEGE